MKFFEFFKNANYPMCIYLFLVHLGAIYGLFYCLLKCLYSTLVFAMVLSFLSGLGITMGAHRLWSHRSYKANCIVRCVLMLFNSIANQGTLYHWCRDHRVHHKYSETTGDPHDATRGFFFAHVGWLLVKKHPDVQKCGQKLSFKDLEQDGFVAFQKKYDPFFNFFMCFALPTIVCSFFWNESKINAFCIAGLLRYIFVLHSTWLVNSAAHLYGQKPYDPSINPSENPIVAVFSIGEGWHNWHHKYPYDYAASELGISAQFNPTKLVIGKQSPFFNCANLPLDTFAKIGWITDRKRADKAWAIAKTKSTKKIQ